MLNNSGLPNGVYSCQQNRNQELNNRIYNRNISSGPLQPQFSIRSVPTRYTLMSIVDEHPTYTVPLHKYPTYSTSKIFNPGNAQSPWSGYATSVNNESKLRNLFFGLQNCNQNVYVPSSKSDLYNTTVPPPNQIISSELFINEEFYPFNPNTLNVGKEIFNNFTRNQLYDACSQE